VTNIQGNAPPPKEEKQEINPSQLLAAVTAVAAA
jgi:hypothetical protein